VTVALIDDQHLGTVLRGEAPRMLASTKLYTTGYWYVRLCQAVLGAQERIGTLSKPFADLPGALRERAIAAVLELPANIGSASVSSVRRSPGCAKSTS